MNALIGEIYSPSYTAAEVTAIYWVDLDSSEIIVFVMTDQIIFIQHKVD